MIWKQSFFKVINDDAPSIEKVALIGAAFAGAITLSDIHSQLKETRGKAQLGIPMGKNPADSQFKLQSPYQYQFEGGKHTSLKPLTTQHSPLYS